MAVNNEKIMQDARSTYDSVFMRLVKWGTGLAAIATIIVVILIAS